MTWQQISVPSEDFNNALEAVSALPAQKLPDTYPRDKAVKTATCKFYQDLGFVSIFPKLKAELISLKHVPEKRV